MLYVIIVSPNGIVTTMPVMSIANQTDNITLSCRTDAHESTNTHYTWFHNIADILCSDTDCSTGYSFNLTTEGKYNRQ